MSAWRVLYRGSVEDRWWGSVIEDRWWVTTEIATGEPDGGTETYTIPQPFDYLTAETVAARLNNGKSICEMCDGFKLGSCEWNCEDECEESGLFAAFEMAKEEPEAVELTWASSEQLTPDGKAYSGRVKERKRTFAKVFDFWATTALMLIALTVFVGLAYKVNMWLVICLYWAVLALKNCALFATHKDSDK